MNSPRPRILKSVFTASLGLVVFGLTYLFSKLMLLGILYLLSEVVGKFLYILFETPDFLAESLSAAIAYGVTGFLLKKLNKDIASQALAYSIAGIIIVVIHALSLILNLIYSENIFPNILQGIAGFALFFQGKRIKRTSLDTEEIVN